VSYDYRSSTLEPAISIFTTQPHLNPANLSFRENAFRTSVTQEDTVAWTANAKLPVTLGGGEGHFKFGAKYKAGEREADENRFRDRAATAAPSGTLQSFLSGEPSRNYSYDLGFKVQPGLADAYYDQRKATSPIRAEQSATADYQVDETVLAGYALWALDFDRLGVLAGVGSGRTETEGAAPVFNAATGVISTRTDKRSYSDVFPGVTLRYAFNDGLIGRAVVSRGMTRPNFTDIVPRALETQEGSTLVVQQGNPELTATLSNNLDVSVEYYYDTMGLVSASAFYKDLKDYAYTLRSNGSYLGQAAILVRPENAPNGSLNGVELAWQQQFTALPGWLSGFGVFANVTWMDTIIDFGRS